MSDSHEHEVRELRSLYWSERDPDGRGFAPLADACRRSGNHLEAKELLAEGLERLPHFASGHVVAARLHLDMGDVSAAAASLDRVLELDGENAEALRELGAIREQGGQPEDALHLFKRLAAVASMDSALADRIRSLEETLDTTGATASDEPIPISELVASAGDDSAGEAPWEDWENSDDEGAGVFTEDPPVAESSEADVDVGVDLEAVLADGESDVDLEAVAVDEAPFEPAQSQDEAPFDIDPVAIETLEPEDETSLDEEPKATETLKPQDEAPFDIDPVAVETLDSQDETPFHGDLRPSEVVDHVDEGPPAEYPIEIEARETDNEERIGLDDSSVESSRDVIEVEAESEAEVIDALVDPEPVSHSEERAPVVDHDRDVVAIDELVETSPWIADHDEPGPPAFDDELYTRTLAELYADQGLYGRAVEVYEHLVEAEPGDPDLPTRLGELQALARADAPARSGGWEDLSSEAEDHRPESVGSFDASDVGSDVVPAAHGTDPQGASDIDSNSEIDPALDEDIEVLAADLATGPETDANLSTPFAWSDPEPETEAEGDSVGRPVTDYFNDLLTWQPTEAGPAPAIESPEEAVSIGSLAPDAPTKAAVPDPQTDATVVPIASLAPDPEPTIVPIDSLAPSTPEPGGGERTAQFQDWMRRLRE